MKDKLTKWLLNELSLSPDAAGALAQQVAGHWGNRKKVWACQALRDGAGIPLTDSLKVLEALAAGRAVPVTVEPWAE